MRYIDEEYTRHPFLGTRRMRAYLKTQGYCVNRKRLQRLYRLMGLETVYPKRNLSKANAQHRKFPYLLKGVAITRCNQVWSTDITYVRLNRGYVYLIAIIDWYSRYVLDWELSITLEADFCVETLNRVMEKSRCEIFNTDQGSQFTSDQFIQALQRVEVKISMDGKGRALDNVFVERLWRSVKYECVYLNQWESVQEAREGLANYFNYYNYQRPHQSLNYQTPWAVFNS